MTSRQILFSVSLSSRVTSFLRVLDNAICIYVYSCIFLCVCACIMQSLLVYLLASTQTKRLCTGAFPTPKFFLIITINIHACISNLNPHFKKYISNKWCSSDSQCTQKLKGGYSSKMTEKSNTNETTTVAENPLVTHLSSSCISLEFPTQKRKQKTKTKKILKYLHTQLKPSHGKQTPLYSHVST